MGEFPRVLGQREPDESCSQYIFGPEDRMVDLALRDASASGNYRVVGDDDLKSGDIIFYNKIAKTPTVKSRDEQY
jgi:hypothetical protein